MKIKQEASGGPQNATRKKKRGTICNNMKMMVNSFWGKFGQHPNQTEVTIFTKPSEFFQIIKDD